MAQSIDEYETCARLLHSELRQVRRRTDMSSTGATIHRLRNHVASAQCGLGMVDAKLQDGNVADLDRILTMVQDSLRQARALIAQTRQLKRWA
jgi:hypothetical protein